MTPHLGPTVATIQQDTLMVKPSRSELFSEEAARQTGESHTFSSREYLVEPKHNASNFFSKNRLEERIDGDKRRGSKNDYKSDRLRKINNSLTG